MLTPRRLFTNIIVFLLSTVFLFLALEFVLRYVWTDWKKSWDKTQSFRYKVAPDPAKFRLGLEEYFKKDPGAFRIIVLGDSFTYGDKISDPDNIYTVILEKKLNQEYRGKYKDLRVEVVNMGVCGFSTFNELELLIKHSLKLKPDMVMVQFLSNDTEVSSDDFWHFLAIDKFKISEKLIPNKHVHEWLLHNSYLYSFLNNRYFILQCRFKIPPNHWVKDENPGWGQCQLALRYMTAFCLANNLGRPAMVIFPFFSAGKWTPETFPERITHQKVTDAARNSGFYVLDLLPVYLKTNRDLKTFWALPLDYHPNEEAHYIAAMAIGDFLIKNRIVEDRIEQIRQAQSQAVKTGK